MFVCVFVCVCVWGGGVPVWGVGAWVEIERGVLWMCVCVGGGGGGECMDVAVAVEG